jgi:uncharacterized membrane protein
MREHPIPLPVTAWERLWIALSGMAFLVQILLVVEAWSGLPERIPSHFGLTGEADRWGSRLTILLLPLISLGLNSICLFIAKRHWLHNVPWRLTAENSAAVYRASRSLLLQLAAVISSFLTWTTWRTILTAHEQATGVGPAYVPSFIAASACVVAIFFYRGQRAATASARPLR